MNPPYLKILALVALFSAVSLTACAPTATPPAPPPPSNGTNTAPVAVTPPAPSPVATDIENNLGLIQTAASLATTAVLNLTESNQAKRTALANEIYSSANGINTLAGGGVPTVAQFTNVLNSFGTNPNDAQYASYVQGLSGIYANYYSQLNGNGKVAVDLLIALSKGAEQGAQAYSTVNLVVPAVPPAGN